MSNLIEDEEDYRFEFEEYVKKVMSLYFPGLPDEGVADFIAHDERNGAKLQELFYEMSDEDKDKYLIRIK